MVLETERLILDKWQPSDWEAFRPIATDPQVMRFITGGVPWSDDQIQRFVNGQVQRYAESGYCRWKLFLKPGGEFIGFCGVGQFRDYPEPEIGWWLAPQYWGRGLATEAARAALKDALERVGLRRIVSVARPENVASTRIMEKIGLRLETPFEHDGLHLVRYSISRDPSPTDR